MRPDDEVYRMKRNAIWISFAVTWFLLGIVIVQLVSVTIDQGRDDWLAIVHLVGQRGRQSQGINYWLGRPTGVLSVADMKHPIYADIYVPTGTRRVLMYSRGIFNAWTVFFFVGRDGEVLGYALSMT